MTPDQTELARRLVACPRWRWVPGMRATRPDGTFPLRVVAVVGGFTAAHEEHAVGDAVGACRGVWQSDVPDLTDPATLGCILALVREAWANPRLVAIYCEPAHPGQSEGWAVQAADNRLPVAGGDYWSEAEALVAALEAA